MDANATEAKLIRLTARPTLHVRGIVKLSGLQDWQGAALSAIFARLRSEGLEADGHPYMRYHRFDEAETDAEVGVPLADPVAGDAQTAAGELPGGDALSLVHLGSHERLGDAYASLAEHVTMRGLAAAGPAWEIYHWIDPSAELDPRSWPAPSEWRTTLVQPVREHDRQAGRA